nr:PAS domain S-box protein [uncultured Mucilaginibacter sp.]
MTVSPKTDPPQWNNEFPHVFGGNKLFQKLIENSHSGITLFDRKLKVLYRSPSAEHIVGWKRADISENSINDLTHPDDIKIVREKLDRVLANPGLPVSFTFRTKHFLGHFIWIDATFTNMLHDADVRGIICNFRDISAQKNIETALRQSLHELSDYKYALDESAIVAITDHKGLINHVNDNFCSISKYSREELLGQDHRIINSSHHDKAFIKNIWTTIAKGNIWKGELKNKAKDGSYYWVDTTIVPFLNEAGKPYQYVAIRSDITQRKIRQEKVLENSRFIKTITDNLPAMIAYWTTDLHCLFANKTLLDWFEMTPQQMHGMHKQEMLSVDEFASYEPYIKGVLNGTPQSFERAFVKKDGKTIYTYTQYLPDKQGGIVRGFYSLISDITEIKLAEQALKTQTEKADQATSLAHIGNWEIDLKKQTVYWSAITKEILRVDSSFEPTLELGVSLYKEGKSRDTVLKVIKNAMEHGTPWDEELEVHSPAGIVKWVRVIGDAEFAGGVCVRLYGSCQDINIRKEAELQTQATLIEKNTILESIADAFFAVDKNWTVTYWNKVAEVVLGKSKTEMLNNNLWEVFNDSVASNSYKNYMQAMESQEPAHFEDYYPPLQKWYEISAYPSNRGLSVYFKDITERKLHDIKLLELNKNLRIQAKELAISNAELEQFAYVASHDLQEPLRMVTSFLTQLERKYNAIIDDKGKQYIHFAVDGAKRMRQIILDLLEFSRVGKLEDKLEEVDINTLIKDILALYRKQIDEKHAKVLFEGLPVMVAYKTSLRQVFQNLISNSLKYSRSGVVPLIHITCNDNDTHWCFAVKDNGIGIDSEYFEKIFIIFQRLHGKNEYSGTGMGLAVTKKIVESLGGKIWVESTEGAGCDFYFTILKNL